MSTIDAGWYPDSRDPRFVRYWDGNGWTEYVNPRGQRTVDPEPNPYRPRHPVDAPHRVWPAVIGGLASVAALVVFAAMLADDPGPSAPDLLNVGVSSTTCEELADEALLLAQTNGGGLWAIPLAVYEPKVVSDRFAEYNDGTLTVPQGETKVVVLECLGMATFDSGADGQLMMQVQVDLNGERWVYYEPVL